MRWGTHTRTVERQALGANLVADVGLQAAVHWGTLVGNTAGDAHQMSLTWMPLAAVRGESAMHRTVPAAHAEG